MSKNKHKKYEYKKEEAHSEDKCDNCGETNSTQYWDYDDESVLCEKCHNEIGDEWYENVQEELAGEEDEEEVVEEEQEEAHHKKTKSYINSEKKTSMKTYIIGGAILILALILIFSVRSLVSASTTGEQYGSANSPTGALGNTGAATGSGNVQNAKLALVDFSYTLTPKKIVKGVPVRIEVDASTLSGCMTTVVIKDFGVTKRIKPGDNIIEFTPDKTGTFWITCGMGMGPGSFEVVNPDGTPDPNAKVQAAPASSCGGGGGGGGCGCGGG
jgi:hypothetical protein